MTHDQFLEHIRQRYADLIDPEWKDENFRYFLSINEGWQPLVIEYFDRVQAHLRKTGWIGRYYVRQIKEKFGALRIYLRPKPTVRPDVDGFLEDFDSAPPEVYEPLGQIYDDISERSQHICEECGQSGELRKLDGWYATCCDRHFGEWKERKAKRERGQ